MSEFPEFKKPTIYVDGNPQFASGASGKAMSEFDEKNQDLKEATFEWALKPMSETEVLTFKSVTVKTREELFPEAMIAGKSFIEGARWQHAQMKSAYDQVVKERDELKEERKYWSDNFVKSLVELETLKKCLFQMQNASIDLADKLKAALEARNAYAKALSIALENGVFFEKERVKMQIEQVLKDSSK